MTSTRKPPWILPVIVISQFAGGSPWFAGNAVLEALQRQWALGSDALGHLTSAVQLGFIAGTLCFAYLAISDRYPPRIVFFVCSLLGALFNLLIYVAADGFHSILLYRFLTGFFLAGIYPVGMKIAAGWYRQGLGRAMGFLIGALVLGTAFPHLVKGMGSTLPWQAAIIATSALSAIGGVLVLLLVPAGPYMRKGNAINGQALKVLFRSKPVRAAAIGYFGHMWELYTFWAFVPVVLGAYLSRNPAGSVSVSLCTFCIMAGGFIGCVVGGFVSLKKGSAHVACFCLAASGGCCLLSPALFFMPFEICLGVLLFWGMVVVADSPQFSTLVATTAPPHLVGSVLTAANCIGFSITIVSIQLVNYMAGFVSADWLLPVLAVGPLIGLIAMRPLLSDDPCRP